MKPAIFLDRDGTINRNCPYCKNADEIKIFDDVFVPLKRLSKKYYIIIVTNQSGISRGYFTKKDLEGMHEKIKREIVRHGGRIDAIYYCPHLPEEGCRCRKPKTGMIESAISDFDIDMSRSYVVGDSDADMGMGKRSGLTTIRVRETGKAAHDFYAKDFYGVMAIIDKNSGNANPKELRVPKIGLILAGGKGTRMRPLTYKIPKPMARVSGRPLIEHAIEELKRNGILKIYVSVGYKASVIKRHLKDGSALGVSVEYVTEPRPLGTGGGARLALGKIKEKYGNVDVFVTNGDDIFRIPIARMYAQHKSAKATLTLTLKRVKDMTGSGVAVLNGKRITGFVEKPEKGKAPSNLVNLGRYITNTSILKSFPKLKKFSLERDFLQKHAKRIRTYGFVVSSRWHQINTMEALERAGHDTDNKGYKP